MMRPFNSEKLRTGATIFLIASFLLLLWLPILDSFFSLDKAPVPDEKRAPAKFPTFKSDLKGLREYFAGLETYYNDHFGFRKRLIRWCHRWKRDWFNESAPVDVMKGRDGWLFFSGHHMIQHYRGTLLFEPEELKAWQDLLETRQRWCAQRNIRYLFVVPPDKHSIYPEYLPEWLTPANPTTKLDQFLAHMRANTSVQILDLRPALLEAKKTGRTYLLSDTHWNFYGAFMACRSLIREIGKHLPHVEPLSLSDFEQKFSEQPGGDLTILLGQQQSIVEKDYVTLVPKPPLKALKHVSVTNLIDKKWVSKTEPGITDNPNATGKAMIFHDSFAGGWVPFLGYNFNKTIFVWQYNWDKALIEREKPDIVIDEMLERYLVKVDPKKILKTDDEPWETIASHNYR